jgi:TPR repeat protein
LSSSAPLLQIWPEVAVMRVVIRFVVLIAFLLSPAALLAGDVQKGLAAYDMGDYETSFAECMEPAEEGDPAAQFCIGRLYANGFGVIMDDAEALKWYGLAAEQGHAEAQFNLGVMHANGWGVPMNDVEAAKYYRMAAEQGFVQAMTSLAYVTYRGIGVEEDLVEGYMWYDIAAELGEISAVSDREDLADKLSPDEVLRAQAMASDWLEKRLGKGMHAGRIDR